MQGQTHTHRPPTAAALAQTRLPVQAVVTQDAEALSAARLAQADGPTIQRFFDWPKPVPLQDLRAGLVREVCSCQLWHVQDTAARHSHLLRLHLNTPSLR